jgi:hypothetical protein
MIRERPRKKERINLITNFALQQINKCRGQKKESHSGMMNDENSH